MGRFDQLDKLALEITLKAAALPDQSYTARLIGLGVSKCAQKFGEEAVELALASVSGDSLETTNEAADVLYHFLVLLKAAGISPDDVMTELRRREGMGGLVEKASRGNG